MPLPGSGKIPSERFAVINTTAEPCLIKPAEPVLCLLIALRRGLQEPFAGSHIITRHSFTCDVQDTD